MKLQLNHHILVLVGNRVCPEPIPMTIISASVPIISQNINCKDCNEECETCAGSAGECLTCNMEQRYFMENNECKLCDGENKRIIDN